MNSTVIGYRKWLILRRDLQQEKSAYYLAFGEEEVLLKVGKVAGSRWTIEECFEMAKQEVGIATSHFRCWYY